MIVNKSVVSQNRGSVRFQNLSKFFLEVLGFQEIGPEVANQMFQLVFLPLPLSPSG